MKKATEIVRFLSAEKQILYGQRLSPNSKEAYTLISNNPFESLELSSVKATIHQVLAPILPTQIIGIGLNYRQHAIETKQQIPTYPIVFMKTLNTIIGHEETIYLPECTRSPDEVDYEAELGVIIGKDCRNVKEEDALSYVLGYTCVNDLSARRWQGLKGGNQWCRGKSFDTFCPIGPIIMTKESIEDPNYLSIQGKLNAQVMQESNTSDMIFSVRSLIAQLSQDTTLKQGTLILTGTPSGVGFTRNPPIYLKDGDVYEVVIEKIGTLRNTVKNAPII